MTARPSRRAARPAGPVTPTTEQLTGAWTPEATTLRTQGARRSGAEPSGPAAPRPDGERTRSAEPVRSGQTGLPGGTTRVGRRVTTSPVPGSDPTPSPEPPRLGTGENDARLLGERPPHWG
jgi:hypothetical protein